MLIALQETTVELRPPQASDGPAIWQLVRKAGMLDLNSAYAYLLLGEHFSETSVVAEKDGEILGFISAYIPPQTPDSIFIWQVGVDANMRKQGLALKMLLAILRRDACRNIRVLNTTITPSNKASRALFTALAGTVDGTLQEQPAYFRHEWFPEEGHEAESLFSISPIRLPETN